jgi:hypothetical protein
VRVKFGSVRYSFARIRLAGTRQWDTWADGREFFRLITPEKRSSARNQVCPAVQPPVHSHVCMFSGNVSLRLRRTR